MGTIIGVGAKIQRRPATWLAMPEPEEPQPSNYERIAALTDALAIHVNTRDGQSDLFEESSDEGELIAHTPEGMFTNTRIVWLERVTGFADGLDGTNDDGDTYTQVVLQVQRGGSTAHVRRYLNRLSEEWAWVLINETTQEWIMWPAAGGTTSQVSVTYYVVPSYIDDANPGSTGVQAIAQSFSDGETLTAGTTFQNALQDAEVVLALIPDNTFRPFMPDEEN